PSEHLIRWVLAADGGTLQLAGAGFEGFDDLQCTLGVEQVFLRQGGLDIFIQYQCLGQVVKFTGNLELPGPLGQAKAIHIALVRLDVAALEEDCQCFEDCRFAIVIAANDAGHGFVDRNDGGVAVATEMGELDGLETHGDFLIYSWPEKAFWLKDSNALPA